MTTATEVGAMKAAQVAAAGAGLDIIELEIPDPGRGQIRIKVQACGVCYSDSIVHEGRGQESPIRTPSPLEPVQRPRRHPSKCTVGDHIHYFDRKGPLFRTARGRSGEFTGMPSSGPMFGK